MEILESIQLLDEHDVSKKMKQSVQTLRNNRYKGIGIPYVKIGRSVRYRISDVRDFMEQNLVSTHQEG